MTDTIDPEPPVGRERSALMARIKGKNTRPEMIVRRWLHREGYRFRLHRADLPGRPDITLPRYKTVVFVHGCFWHRHPGCRRSALPSTRRSFWETKLTRNAMRDAEATLQLERMGWRVIVVWECETRRSDVLAERFGDLRIARAASESP